MQLNLRFYQLKIDCYNYKIFYVSPPPRKIPIEVIQKKKIWESKYISTKKNQQNTKEDSKREKNRKKDLQA